MEPDGPADLAYRSGPGMGLFQSPKESSVGFSNSRVAGTSSPEVLPGGTHSRRYGAVSPWEYQPVEGELSLGSRLGVVGDLQQIYDEVIFYWAFDCFPIRPFDADRRVHPQRHRFDHNVPALLATLQSQVDVARRRVVASIALPIVAVVAH
jgi:hypothetical protein